jgi:hypothetical protein
VDIVAGRNVTECVGLPPLSVLNDLIFLLRFRSPD